MAGPGVGDDETVYMCTLCDAISIPQHEVPALGVHSVVRQVKCAVVAKSVKVAPICICRYNVREVFELYRQETSSAKIKDVIQRGEEDLLAFSQFQKLDSNSLQVVMTTGRNTRQSSKE